MTHEFVSLSVYFCLNGNLIGLNFIFSSFVSFELVSGRKAMLVFADFSIRAVPFPTVLVFFNSFKEELADDFRSCSFHHLLFFYSEMLVKFIFSELAKLFPSDGVHDQLGSLINIQIDFLISVKSQVVGVNTFLAFLAQALFKVRTNSVGWIAIVRIIAVFVA